MYSSLLCGVLHSSHGLLVGWLVAALVRVVVYRSVLVSFHVIVCCLCGIYISCVILIRRDIGLYVALGWSKMGMGWDKVWSCYVVMWYKWAELDRVCDEMGWGCVGTDYRWMVLDWGCIRIG